MLAADENPAKTLFAIDPAWIGGGTSVTASGVTREGKSFATVKPIPPGGARAAVHLSKNTPSPSSPRSRADENRDPREGLSVVLNHSPISGEEDRSICGPVVCDESSIRAAALALSRSGLDAKSSGLWLRLLRRCSSSKSRLFTGSSEVSANAESRRSTQHGSDGTNYSPLLYVSSVTLRGVCCDNARAIALSRRFRALAVMACEDLS